jgi:hypothetical protein
MRMLSEIGTGKATLHPINVRAGEGWEPVMKIPQFQDDMVCSFRTAADFLLRIEDNIKSYIVSSS